MTEAIQNVDDPAIWFMAMLMTSAVALWLLNAWMTGYGGIGAPNDPSVAHIMNPLGAILAFGASCFSGGMALALWRLAPAAAGAERGA